MKRWVVVVAALVGCNPSPTPPAAPAQLLAKGAVIAAVSPTSNMAALIASATATLPTLQGLSDGVLEVALPTPNPTVVAVDADVTRVIGFTPVGDYLVYGVDRAQALGGATFFPMVWKAGWAQPIALSTTPVLGVSFSRNGTVLYSGTAQGSGTLSRVQLADCDSGACQLQAIATANLFELSDDGSKCVFQTVSADGSSAGLFYIDETATVPTRVATVGASVVGPQALGSWRLIGLTGDGTRLAYVTADGNVQVASTANLASVPWSAVPAGWLVQGMLFPNPRSLFLELRSADGSFVYQSSAAAMRRLAAGDAFDVNRDANDQVATVMFWSLPTPSPEPIAVSVVDVATGKSASLAQQTYALPKMSSDGTTALVFDFMTEPSGTAQLFLVDLPSLFSASPETTALGMSWVTAASLQGGTNRALYYQTTTQDEVFAATHGTPPKELASAALIFFSNASAFYFTANNDEAPYVEQPGTANVSSYWEP